jgi:hypothetical protein
VEGFAMWLHFVIRGLGGEEEGVYVINEWSPTVFASSYKLIPPPPQLPLGYLPSCNVSKSPYRTLPLPLDSTPPYPLKPLPHIERREIDGLNFNMQE